MSELAKLPKNIRLRAFRHYVIDIETVDTKPTAAVLSIALVKIVGWRGVKVKTWTVSAKGQEGRTIDFETVLWWLRQESAAQAAAAAAERMDLDDVLRELYDCLMAEGLDFCLWAKPQHFDIAILESLFRDRFSAAGAKLLHRRRVHNARTLYEATSLVLGSNIDEDEASGVKHDPMADALRTADTIGRCLELLSAASVNEDRPALWRVDSLESDDVEAVAFLAASSLQHAALQHRCIFGRRRIVEISRIYGPRGCGVNRTWCPARDLDTAEQAALLRYLEGRFYERGAFGLV